MTQNTLDTALHRHGNHPLLPSIMTASFAQANATRKKITNMWTVPDMTLDATSFTQSH